MQTTPSTPIIKPGGLTCRYPGGFAWPARDDRFGRYITCPNKATEPFGMAVHDDFGNLVPVPSRGIACVFPTTGVLA